jgi:hypothetical protein
MARECVSATRKKCTSTTRTLFPPNAAPISAPLVPTLTYRKEEHKIKKGEGERMSVSHRTNFSSSKGKRKKIYKSK